MRISGFSLIELMIYLALFSVMSISIFTAYNFFLTSRIETEAIAELHDESRPPLDAISNVISRGDSFDLVEESNQDCLIIGTLISEPRVGLGFSDSQRLTAAVYGGPGASAPRSIGFWMRQDLQTDNQTIVGFGDDGDGQRFIIRSDSAVDSISLDVGGKTFHASTGVSDGSWHHVFVTYDNTVASEITTSNTAIYIDGNPEVLTASNNSDIALNTDNSSVRLSLGGYGADANFEGHLSSVKIWHSPLSASDIWDEVFSETAVNSQDLALELTLNEAILDTSGSAYAFTNAVVPEYFESIHAYSEKTVYAFKPSENNSNFHSLWQYDYIDTSPDQSQFRCPQIDEDAGWFQSYKNDWLKTGDDFFTLDDGVVQINVEAAKDIGFGTLTAGGANLILAGQRENNSELCRIAPHISGFDSGGAMIAEAIVRIDDGFESSDSLGFIEADKSAAITVVVNGVNKTYYSYKNIADGDGILWPDITAEYEPLSGVLKICTSSGNDCSAPDITQTQPLDLWEKLFRQITYDSNSQTYQSEKVFIFSLGEAVPCRVKNHLACQNVADADDNDTQCYHWFDFIDYDDLGANYACHSISGTGADSYGQCLGDWEDARLEASAKDLFGLEGYLATLTTEAEQICAYDLLVGASGWLGASDRNCERDKSCGDATDNTDNVSGPYGRYNSKDSNGEGYWYWVTGPEGAWNDSNPNYQDHNDTIGSGLYIGADNGSGFTVFDPPDDGVNPILESHIQWGANNPDNWVNSGGIFPHEDYMYRTIGGSWNDYTGYYKVDGYIVEYGGMAGDADRTLARSITLDISDFLKNCQ